MPSLSNVRNLGDKTAYIYDISADDVTSLVTQMSSTADAPIAFMGRMNGITEPIDELMHVDTLLSAGGQVAAQTSSGGVPVNVQFSGDQMVIIPSDGEQSTADMFASAGDFAYADESDFDPFASASDFPVPDPRGRSQQLANRYGDPEDEYGYEDDAVYSSPGSSATGDAPADVVKVSDWLLTLILLMLPVVNIVMIIVWLVSKKTNPSKKNYLKVQIVFMLVGALLSAFTVVAALQMGVVGALVGNQPQAAQTENMNMVSNSNLERRSDNTNMNSNANVLSNVNENSNENSGEPATTIPEDPTQLGELSQQTSGVLAVDTVTRAVGPANRSVAVVTLTLNNTTDAEAPASALIDITGHQGQNALEPNFEPIDGFNPDTFNMPIRPHESGTFQICYFLVDDQDLKIDASMKATHEVILDATQMLH